MNYVSALPHAITVFLLGEWLPQQSLGKLDAALCSKNSRERYHELLSSQEFIIQHSVKVKEWDNYAAWHIKRKTKMSRLVLPSSAESANPEALAEFLRSVGGPEGKYLTVLTIQLHLPVSCIDSGVCELSHLQELFVISVTDMKVVDALVRNSFSSLRKLAFDVSSMSTEDDTYFAHCNFRNLTSLSVSWCNRFDIPLIRMLSTTAKLEDVSIIGADRVSDDLYHLLLTRNPGLKSLRFQLCPGLTSDVLRFAAPSLSALERVTFEYCRQVDTAAITALATHCPRLRHVTLSGNSPTFLVSAVEALAKYCDGTLESLRVDGYNDVNVRCLQALGTTCTALQTLSAWSYERGQTRGLVYKRDVIRCPATKLPALQSLDLGGNYVDDQSFREIALMSGGLRRLILRSAWGYTASGAQALAKSAPHLREVVINGKEQKNGHGPNNTAMVATWKKAAALTQPQMKITLGDA
jgi:hypothetical protein